MLGKGLLLVRQYSVATVRLFWLCNGNKSTFEYYIQLCLKQATLCEEGHECVLQRSELGDTDTLGDTDSETSSECVRK